MFGESIDPLWLRYGVVIGIEIGSCLPLENTVTDCHLAAALLLHSSSLFSFKRRSRIAVYLNGMTGVGFDFLLLFFILR